VQRRHTRLKHDMTQKNRRGWCGVGIEDTEKSVTSEPRYTAEGRRREFEGLAKSAVNAELEIGVGDWSRCPFIRIMTRIFLRGEFETGGSNLEFDLAATGL
jgi:hypothetical protein